MAPIDEEVVDRPVFAEADGMTDRGLEEGDELGLRHLARGHLEFAMARLAPPYRVTLDAYVVRRVGDDHLGPLAPQQPLVRGALQGVAADQPVPAQLPAISRL